MKPARRKVVLGIGNILTGDEGIGIHAVRRLEREYGPSAGVEFLDGGTLGLSLLTIIEECSHVLIIDAVNARRPPGSIVELHRDEIPLFSGIKVSQHQATMQEVLGLASIRGCLPDHLHLLGIQPACLDVGIGLSPAAENAMPELLHRAKALLTTWQETSQYAPASV
jgi:hydrogenase maturation protease